eukprot:6409448-Amphidinium_carterae.1
MACHGVSFAALAVPERPATSYLSSTPGGNGAADRETSLYYSEYSVSSVMTKPVAYICSCQMKFQNLRAASQKQ